MEINNYLPKNSIAILILFFSTLFLYSQKDIQGVIYDQVTKEPLVGVVVYLDGTTNGTITNEKGKFYIKFDQIANNTLIISYLGYQTKLLDSQMILNKEYEHILLQPQVEELEAVVLQKDPLSRSRKLRYFRKYFLGDYGIQEKCKIINEKDIELHYNVEKKVLYGSASVPLKIRNKLLGYEILYTLFDFELQFGNDTIKKNLSYFSGTPFFKELRKKTLAKHIKNRETYYKGSSLHFMRALATKTLAENKFRAFHNGFAGDPYAFFTITRKKRMLTKVEMALNVVSILYDQKLRTKIEVPEGNFLIDKMGNYSPPTGVIFDGYMGSLKIGTLLPLDYVFEAQ